MAAHITPQWLAGFLDGEGCLSTIRTSAMPNPRIQIVQKDREVLEAIKEYVGYGTIGRFKSGVHVLKFTSRESVLRVLDLVEPYAVTKRDRLKLVRELAQLVLPACGKRPPVSDADRARRLVLADQLRVRKDNP